MPAYAILQSLVSDPARMQQYREAVMPVIARYGGRHIIRGGPVEVLEGRHDGRGLSVFEFPSLDAIRMFWKSPDYAAIKAIRYGAATFDVWAVPGA